MQAPTALQRFVKAWLGALALIAILDGSVARADYKIAPGDVVRLTVVGVPELTATAPVDTDGRAVLPLVGGFAVGGLTSDQATAKARAVLIGKELNRHLGDGREIPVVLSPGQIRLVVAEYRPIYVNGDVGKAGALTYQPGLTVRKAIALVGGLGRPSAKVDDPNLRVEVTGEYNSLSVEYKKWQEVVVRLQAELDGKKTVDVSALSTMGVSATLSASMLELSQDRLRARTADLDQERSYLAAAAEQEGQRAQFFDEQRKRNQEALTIDTADLQRYQDLFNKGDVAVPTLSLAQRTVLASSARALQTSVALTSVQGVQSDVRRRLQSLNELRRIDVLAELQDATINLASTRAKLQAASTKMRLLGVDNLHSRGIESASVVTLVRSVDGKPSHIRAAPDDVLEPGDVMDVALVDAQP